MVHVMIDLETLAVDSKPVILSIGAITFNPLETTVPEPTLLRQEDLNHVTDTQYYEVIDPRQQYERSIDPETVHWWMQQDRAAWPYKEDLDNYLFLEAGMEGLNNFIYNIAPEGIWSHGKDFDIAILRELGLVCDYHKLFDTRTVYYIAGWTPDHIQSPEGFMKHNPLCDCWYQARQVQEALYHIRRDRW